MIENETPTLAEVINDMIEAKILDIHTSMPGKVETYDHTQQKADIKPLLRKKYTVNGGTIVEIPVIPGVPVQWPAANNGAAYIHMPLKSGDLGLIIFTDRSIDAWLSREQHPQEDAGKIMSPNDPRHHDLSDAIFIPGIRPFNWALENTNADNFILQNGSIRIELDPSGKISITGASNELLSVLKDTIDHLVSAKVFTGLGALPFTEATITNLTLDKTNLETLII